MEIIIFIGLIIYLIKKYGKVTGVGPDGKPITGLADFLGKVAQQQAAKDPKLAALLQNSPQQSQEAAKSWQPPVQQTAKQISAATQTKSKSELMAYSDSLLEIKRHSAVLTKLLVIIGVLVFLTASPLIALFREPAARHEIQTLWENRGDVISVFRELFASQNYVDFQLESEYSFVFIIFAVLVVLAIMQYIRQLNGISYLRIDQTSITIKRALDLRLGRFGVNYPLHGQTELKAEKNSKGIRLIMKDPIQGEKTIKIPRGRFQSSSFDAIQEWVKRYNQKQQEKKTFLKLA